MIAQPIMWVGGLLLAAHLLEEKDKVKKVFISFDFDNDSLLKEALVGQAKNPDTPFEIMDQSLKEALTGDWKTKIRPRISEVRYCSCYVWTKNSYGNRRNPRSLRLMILLNGLAVLSMVSTCSLIMALMMILIPILDFKAMYSMQQLYAIPIRLIFPVLTVSNQTMMPPVPTMHPIPILNSPM